MKICIYGAGAIGGYLAAGLATVDGVELSLIARGPHLAAIREKGLKLLIGGAEEMPVEAIAWMERVWAPAKVKMTYASVEMAQSIGFQPCDRRDGYHVDHMDFLPEIIEPDDTGFGELVFTTLSRRTMPLIRYRPRDVTRFLPEPCPCGIPTPRLAKAKGRRDELVVASGGNLYPLMFEQILREVPGLTFDWQVVFRLEGVREVMEIHVETDRADSAGLEADIHGRATDLYPDLMKNLALGIFQMRVVSRRPGTVRSARKLKRLIDLRHGANGVAPKVPEPEPASL